MFLSFIINSIVIIASVESKPWTKLIDKSFDWSQRLSNDLTLNYFSINESKNISKECDRGIRDLFLSLKSKDDWAMKMINSWGRFPPSGVLSGTSTDFGSYDQCLDINPNKVIERPQYCLIDIRPPLPQPMPIHHNLHHSVDVLPIGFNVNNSSNVFKKLSEFASFYYWINIRTGICLPSKCSANDISLLAKGFTDNFGFEFRQTRCETKQLQRDYSFGQIFSLFFMAICLIVIFCATIRDNFIKTSEKSIFVDTFSLNQNVKTLFADRSSDTLTCIHGLRVISMIWIIVCHTIEWLSYPLFARSFSAKSIFSEITTQMVLNGHYAVIIFFFISGTLTSYMTLQYTGGQLSRFSVIGFLISKFLRLTPQLLIFIMVTLLIPLGGWSGPLWNETITPITESCSSNWWYDVLYVQNYLKRSDICGIHTWFLGIDMQYHWMSLPFVVALLYKSKHLFKVIIVLSLMVFQISTVLMHYIHDLPPGHILTGKDDHFRAKYDDGFIWRPWSNWTVFFLGFLFGNILNERKFKKIKKSHQYFSIFIILSSYMVCLLDTYYWSSGKPYGRLNAAFIDSTCRVIWSLSTAALIWLCVSGNGGIINGILSAKVLTPLSRLTYSVYLTHVWVIWVFVGTRRTTIDTDWTELFFIIAHNLFIAYIIGFLFTILFEIPVIKLQRRLKNRLFKTIEYSGEIQLKQPIHKSNI